MTTILNKKIFVINSRNRNEGTDSDFTYTLDIQPSDHFDSVVVLQASIPKSYYMVQANKNTFTLVETNGQVTITIPPGNYSRKVFATVIQNQLNALSPGFYSYQVLIYAKNQTSANSPDTGKFTFVVSNNGSDQPQFVFTSYLFEQMGFDHNSTNTFFNNSLLSSNVIKLIAEDTLYLHSNICQNSSKDDILQEFYAAGSPTYSNILFANFNTPDIYAKPMTSSTSNTFRFYLTDEDDLPIDLNGLNLNLTIMCFRHNDLWSRLSDFISLITYKLATNHP